MLTYVLTYRGRSIIRPLVQVVEQSAACYVIQHPSPLPLAARTAFCGLLDLRLKLLDLLLLDRRLKLLDLLLPDLRLKLLDLLLKLLDLLFTRLKLLDLPRERFDVLLPAPDLENAKPAEERSAFASQEEKRKKKCWNLEIRGSTDRNIL